MTEEILEFSYRQPIRCHFKVGDKVKVSKLFKATKPFRVATCDRIGKIISIQTGHPSGKIVAEVWPSLDNYETWFFVNDLEKVY